MRGEVSDVVGFVSFLVKDHCNVPSSIDVLVSDCPHLKAIGVRLKTRSGDDKVCLIEYFFPFLDFSHATSIQGLTYYVWVRVQDMLEKLKVTKETVCAAK